MRAVMISRFLPVAVGVLGVMVMQPTVSAQPGPTRAREAGVVIGILEPGPGNTITDVAGVTVGHVTLQEGELINTGITAVLPHAGNLFQDKVPAGVFVANGFGKFMGSTQVRELGELETPILLITP